MADFGFASADGEWRLDTSWSLPSVPFVNAAALCRARGWRRGDVLMVQGGGEPIPPIRVRLTAIGDGAVLARNDYGDRLGQETEYPLHLCTCWLVARAPQAMPRKSRKG